LGERPATPPPGQAVIVAESDSALAGFVHLHADHDPTRGSYVHALHGRYGAAASARLMMR
jgi:hypothetical protein